MGADFTLYRLLCFCQQPVPERRQFGQAGALRPINDVVGQIRVFGVMAVGSFSSGGLLSAYGWNTVLWVSLLPLVLAVVALALTVPKYMAGRFDLKGQGALATRAHFLLKQIPGAIRHLTSGRCQMFISRSRA